MNRLSVLYYARLRALLHYAKRVVPVMRNIRRVLLVLLFVFSIPGAVFPEKKALTKEDANERLFIAVCEGDKYDVEKAINAGANVNAKNFSGDSALIIAARYGKKDSAAILIKKGANINIRGFFGETPLMTASHFGRVEMAKLLVEAGADINARDHNGFTAMDEASFQRHGGIVDLLKKAGAKGRNAR